MSEAGRRKRAQISLMPFSVCQFPVCFSVFMLYIAWKRGLPQKCSHFVPFRPIKKPSFDLLCVLEDLWLQNHPSAVPKFCPKIFTSLKWPLWFVHIWFLNEGVPNKFCTVTWQSGSTCTKFKNSKIKSVRHWFLYPKLTFSFLMWSKSLLWSKNAVHGRHTLLLLLLSLLLLLLQCLRWMLLLLRLRLKWGVPVFIPLDGVDNLFPTFWYVAQLDHHASHIP